MPIYSGMLIYFYDTFMRVNIVPRAYLISIINIKFYSLFLFKLLIKQY